MRRLAPIAFALVLVWGQPLRADDLLTEPAVFADGWARLVQRMTDRADVAEITITADRIHVRARTAAGGARLDDWQVRLVDTLAVKGVVVDGPLPQPDRAPPAAVEAALFPLPAVAIARLPDIVAAAVAESGFATPGRAVQVRIARPEGPAGAAPVWTVATKAQDETATIRAAADGTITGADLTGTAAPRLAPPPAPPPPGAMPSTDPMAPALAALRADLEDGALIWRVDATLPRLYLRVSAPDTPDMLHGLRWNGARLAHDRQGTPRPENRFRPSFPFTLEESGLANLAQIIAAARAATGREPLMLRTASAEKVPRPGGPPRVVWTLRIQPGEPGGQRDDTNTTVVTLGADASVLSVLPPEGQRPAFDGIGGEGVVSAIATMTRTYGADARLWELQFRPDGVSLSQPHPDKPGIAARATLGGRGLRIDPDFPAMMQESQDTFALSALAQLTPARIEGIKAAALAALSLPEAEVLRLRVWNGAPFRQAPDSGPLINVRVGLPPDGRGGGYAVFTLEGDLVRAVR
jgi:hypothetical protein